MLDSIIKVNSFEDILKQAVRREVERAISKVVSEATLELERKLKDSADKIALSICSFYEISRLGSTITIQVKKFEDKKGE